MDKPTTNYQLPTTKSPLLLIVGETASGKSALALELAQKFNGEIIAADSRTIYKGMDIGTAKPSLADQNQVPHHMINIVAPDELFNVGMFKTQANSLINQITSRGKLPIMVGGTGLYIDSILFDYSFSAGKKEKDTQNPRHLKKDESTVTTHHVLRQNTLVLGMQVEKTELNQRITERVQQMIDLGLEQEVRKLSEQYPWDAPGMTAVGYKEWQDYFSGDQSLESTTELITTHTRQYAKRQRTWFKRNSHINWVTKQTDVHKIVMSFLQRL